MTARKTRRSLSVTFLAFVLATPSAPGTAWAAGPPRAMAAGLDERIDVALEGASPAELFASFGEILGLEVVALPAFRGELTMELRGVRVATALTAACESVGCLWRIADGRLRIEADPAAPERATAFPAQPEAPAPGRLAELIDLELVDADLRQVLQAFGSITGSPVDIDPALRGEVTIVLRNTPVRDALDAVCRNQDCRWELVETVDGELLRFVPR